MKKLISVFLIVCMVSVSLVPAFAEETETSVDIIEETIEEETETFIDSTEKTIEEETETSIEIK